MSLGNQECLILGGNIAAWMNGQLYFYTTAADGHGQSVRLDKESAVLLLRWLEMLAAKSAGKD